MSVLVEALLKERAITRSQLDEAIEKQLGSKRSVQSLLMEMGYITEDIMIGIASRGFNMPVVDLSKEKFQAGAMALIPYAVAKRCGIFPVRLEDDSLVVATTDPLDVVMLDELRVITQRYISPILVRQTQIDQFTERCYKGSEAVYDLVKDIPRSVDISVLDTTPVTVLVDRILSDALRVRASDIHIEPKERTILVKYRVDGDLKDVMRLPAEISNPFISRIKIMSHMDISENRKPQDGRFSFPLEGRDVDVRASTIPTVMGERVELRLLDPQESKISLDSLGLRPEELVMLKEGIHKPKGMVLVTGPTGAGKNSTIYAALRSLHDGTKSVITIEDPVEYLVEGFNQIQVNPAKDVTFANGLRSILRQDPDIISVGEIRDNETAEIAFRAAMTGHLVFSTIHTINAVSTVSRLMEIGLESYLIASALILVIAQRLVKRVCPHCREKYGPDEMLTEKFREYIKRFSITSFYRGKGCAACGFSGYRGRIGIFEVLPINHELRELIIKRASEDDMVTEARRTGFKTLTESGLLKVSQGLTTLEEINRIADFLDITTAAAIREERRNRKKIAIADDDEYLLKVLDMYLSKAGYDVIKVRDGEELIEVVTREKPDLVVTDVTMPKMDGLQATRVIKSKLDTASIPVMMLTAREDKESELLGIDVGADDYLSKPFDYDKFLARVRMLLRRQVV